jgi:hypothetical protein
MEYPPALFRGKRGAWSLGGGLRVVNRSAAAGMSSSQPSESLACAGLKNDVPIANTPR